MTVLFVSHSNTAATLHKQSEINQATNQEAHQTHDQVAV
jgi:hypothetical protein